MLHSDLGGLIHPTSQWIVTVLHASVAATQCMHTCILQAVALVRADVLVVAEVGCGELRWG